MIQTPVSVGELIDKLSILQVKRNKIDDENKLKYVNNEFEILDKLREYEKIQFFENHFVLLARQVYITNDKRFELKNKINEISNSELREQKSYQDYKSTSEGEESKVPYIFESPDGGITIYRRKLGEPHDKRELYKNG